MKIRYLSLIVLLVMSVFAPMQAQTYDNFVERTGSIGTKGSAQVGYFRSNENLR